MPTFEHPPDDHAWGEVIPSRYYLGAVSTHIYFAIVLLTILVAIRLLVTLRRTSRGPLPEFQPFSIKDRPSQLSSVLAGEKGRVHLGTNFGPGQSRLVPQTSRARGFVPLRVVSSQLAALEKLPTMDDNKGELGEGHYPWPNPAASRGVSTGNPHDLSHPDPALSTATGRTRHGSPRTSSRGSSRRGHIASPDGIEDPPPREKGKGSMAASNIGDGSPFMGLDRAAVATDAPFQPSSPFNDAPFSGTDLRVPRHFSRPPPPPPLTPPTLSGAFFPFEDRRPSYAASIPPALDMSFIHQPNPEYGASSTSADVLSSSPQSATHLPRRRSYTKSVPVGIPVPTTTATTASASSSTETMTSGSTTNTFSPSSYPPTSPLLPPPPPGHFDPPPPPSAPPEYEFVGGPGGPGVLLSQQEIDLQGEIISVMDDAGHGWKRHTRVYGGGVCLACVAAAARDGGQGGFYGDKVPLEDRR